MSSREPVYDVMDSSTWPHRDPFHTAYLEWLRAHGIDPYETVRTEHHLIDAPLVRVFQYDRDEHGSRYIDPATDYWTLRQPFDVLATTAPPTPEDYA